MRLLLLSTILTVAVGLHLEPASSQSKVMDGKLSVHDLPSMRNDRTAQGFKPRVVKVEEVESPGQVTANVKVAAGLVDEAALKSKILHATKATAAAVEKAHASRIAAEKEAATRAADELKAVSSSVAQAIMSAESAKHSLKSSLEAQRIAEGRRATEPLAYDIKNSPEFLVDPSLFQNINFYNSNTEEAGTTFLNEIYNKGRGKSTSIRFNNNPIALSVLPQTTSSENQTTSLDYEMQTRDAALMEKCSAVEIVLIAQALLSVVKKYDLATHISQFKKGKIN